MSESNGHRNGRQPREEAVAAFAARYEDAYRSLWVTAAAIASPDAAADIVHHAALQALGKLEQFTPGTNFTAWMAQFVRYAALNHMRAQQRRGVSVSLDERLAAEASGRPTGVEALTANGQPRENQPYFDDELMGALKGLGETARACLLLRTVEDMSYAEISRTLGIPEGTVMSHVHRSRRTLRAKLQHKGNGAPTKREGTADA